MKRSRSPSRSPSRSEKILSIFISAHGEDVQLEKTIGENIKNILIVYSAEYAKTTEEPDEILQLCLECVEHLMTFLTRMKLFYTPLSPISGISVPMHSYIKVDDNIVMFNNKRISSNDFYILLFILQNKLFLQQNAIIHEDSYKKFVIEFSRSLRKNFVYLNCFDFIEICNMSDDNFVTRKELFEKKYKTWQIPTLNLCLSPDLSVDETRRSDIVKTPIHDLQFDPLRAKIFKIFSGHRTERSHENRFLNQRWEHISVFSGSSDEKASFNFSIQVCDQDFFNEYQSTITKQNVFSIFNLLGYNSKLYIYLREKIEHAECSSFLKFVFSKIISKINQTQRASQSEIFILLAVLNIDTAFIIDTKCTNFQETYNSETEPRIKRKRQECRDKTAVLDSQGIDPTDEYSMCQESLDNIAADYKKSLSDNIKNTVTGLFGHASLFEWLRQLPGRIFSSSTRQRKKRKKRRSMRKK